MDCWAIIPSADQGSNDNVLRSVAAVGLNDVWSVGYYSPDGIILYTLSEHWNGSTWDLYYPENPSPYLNELNGVTAPASNNVWAAGYYNTPLGDRTLIEKWDGSRWTVSTSANLGMGHTQFKAITAVDAMNGWAVGYYTVAGVQKTLTERTTDGGATWVWVDSPNPLPGNNVLNSVTAIPGSGGDVMAVGVATSGVGRSISMLYHAGSWAPYSPEVVLGSLSDNFKGVRAIDGTRVYAVGDYVNASGVSQTLAEQWSSISHKWNITVPLPGNTSPTENNFLEAVSLLGGGFTNRIWAVGNARAPAGQDKLTAQYYLAGAWTVTSVSGPGTAENQFLGTVLIPGGAGGSGVATTWAVGYYSRVGTPDPYVRHTLTQRYVESASSHP